MANKTQSTTSPSLIRRERELLLSALGGAVRGLVLSCGMVVGAGLLLTYCLTLFRASKDHHVVYSVAALAGSDFRHFLLLVGSILAFITLVAIGFTWAFVRNLRNDKYVSDFLAYRSYRQHRKNGSRKSPPPSRNAEAAMPFLTGAASILDLGDTLAPPVPGLTPRQKDYLALKSDWAAVGGDLQAAVKRMDEEASQDVKGAALGGGGRFA